MSGRFCILALIMAAQTTANVGPLGIPAIAPLIRESLGLSVAQAGSFLSAYYIGPVLMSLPAGRLADRWGVLGTMVLGQAIIAAGLLVAASAPSFAFLMPVMVFAGAGYGMLNPNYRGLFVGSFAVAVMAAVLGITLRPPALARPKPARAGLADGISLSSRQDLAADPAGRPPPVTHRPGRAGGARARSPAR